MPEWIDVSQFGCPYEVQRDACSNVYRHRLISRNNRGEETVPDEWTPGKPVGYI